MWVLFQTVALGWDGGIRTPECWYQKPEPYHLATSHYLCNFILYNVRVTGFCYVFYLLACRSDRPEPYHLATSHYLCNFVLIHSFNTGSNYTVRGSKAQ
jgi:hypothetical protein